MTGSNALFDGMDFRAIKGRIALVAMPNELSRALSLPEMRAERQVAEYASIDQLDRDTLAGVGIVVSPILSDDFDVHDLARRLIDMDYDGDYLAVSSDMPRPQLVQREVASQAKGLKVTVRTVQLRGPIAV